MWNKYLIFTSFIKVSIYVLKCTETYNQKQKKCSDILYYNTFYNNQKSKNMEKNARAITTSLP